MKTITRHLTCRIDFLLTKSDNELGKIFDGNGSQIRKELEERNSNGELLIGSDNCEGFDPVKGCPGHKKV